MSSERVGVKRLSPNPDKCGRYFTIHCRGRTKLKGRAEGAKEFYHWKDVTKQMCQCLRDEGAQQEAKDLDDAVTYREQKEGRFVHVNGDEWHIFTYALRKVSPNDYARIMSHKYSEANKTGWSPWVG